MRTISEVWERIRAHQNEQFVLKRGEPFTYAVSGNAIVTDRSGDYTIDARNLERALELVPIEGPGDIHHLRGPSYVWAILHDARIRGNDW